MGFSNPILPLFPKSGLFLSWGRGEALSFKMEHLAVFSTIGIENGGFTPPSFWMGFLSPLYPDQ